MDDSARHIADAWLATWDLLNYTNYTGRNYVKPDGSDSADCQSWENACSLQRALKHSMPGMEIWVAAGKYKPTTGSDRQATFQLNGDVAMYGGFPDVGNPGFNDRDPATYLTILSGDLSGNDNNNVAADEPSRADNSYHVVTVAGDGAILDGLTITGGNANGASLNTTGGGWDNGGGMYNNHVNPTVRNVTFIGNSAASKGGGMYNYQYGRPDVMNVTFIGNSAQNGGGMSNYFGIYAGPKVMNVTFIGNSASQNGGGINNTHNSKPQLTNVTFSGNSAAYSGGGMYNASSVSKLTNVIIANSISGGDCVNNVGGSLDAVSRNNLIEDASNACGLTNGSKGNIIGSDPLLGAPDDLNGFTKIIPLLSGSPAIDAGYDTACDVPSVGNYDQHGKARVGAACDIGAYEYVEVPMVDVVSHLDKLANASPIELNWRQSINDLKALLGMDHSPAAIKDLAVDLSCPEKEMADSYSRNVWAHRALLKKIAENGGNIPKKLH